jgi:hypothetical protein
MVVLHRFCNLAFGANLGQEGTHQLLVRCICDSRCTALPAMVGGGIGVIDAGDSPVMVDHVTSRLITFSLWQYCGSAFEWNGPGNLSSIGHK